LIIFGRWCNTGSAGEAKMGALKHPAAFAAMVLLMAGNVLAVGWFARHGVDVALWTPAWLQVVNEIAFAICFALLVPLAVFTKTRALSSLGFLIASYGFGASLWLFSLMTTYSLWGVVGAVAGVALLGFGVIPLAMIAALLDAKWAVLGQVYLGVILTCGSWVAAVCLRAEQESAKAGAY
jgi:hypothetical protein